MKLIIVSILALGLAWTLMFGAMKTAEKIAKHQQEQIEAIQP